MQTSLSVLTLEIYYRYLPLYKPEAMRSDTSGTGTSDREGEK